jgi:hypothetical protein
VNQTKLLCFSTHSFAHVFQPYPRVFRLPCFRPILWTKQVPKQMRAQNLNNSVLAVSCEWWTLGGKVLYSICIYQWHKQNRCYISYIGNFSHVPLHIYIYPWHKQNWYSLQLEIKCHWFSINFVQNKYKMNDICFWLEGVFQYMIRMFRVNIIRPFAYS